MFPNQYQYTATVVTSFSVLEAVEALFCPLIYFRERQIADLVIAHRALYNNISIGREF